ncbi:MAG: hypothetical protein ABIS67_02320 [Candidatus Eisenbacteria bacterium]
MSADLLRRELQPAPYPQLKSELSALGRKRRPFERSGRSARALEWSPPAIGPGVYLLRLRQGAEEAIARVTLLR